MRIWAKIREASSGRAIGGLITFVHNKLDKVKLVEKDLHWIILEIINLNQKCIVDSIYLSPSYAYETLQELLATTMSEVKESFPNHVIIIIGDFNATIGNLNQPNYVVFEHTNVTPLRINSK